MTDKDKNNSDEVNKSDDRGIAFGTSVAYDDAYGNVDTTEYVSSLPTDAEETSGSKFLSELRDTGIAENDRAHPSTRAAMESQQRAADDDKNVQEHYRDRQFHREGVTDGMTFKETMQLRAMEEEKSRLLQELEEVDKSKRSNENKTAPAPAPPPAKQARRRRRWDDNASQAAVVSDVETGSSHPTTSTTTTSSSRRRRWDETPVATPAADANVDATPLYSSSNKAQTWDETPMASTSTATLPTASTGTATRKRSRWDSTPAPSSSSMTAATPLPHMMIGGATPSIPITKMQTEMNARNFPWTEAAVSSILPGPEEGYKILMPPDSYKPLRTPGRKLLSTPTPSMTPAGFIMNDPETMDRQSTAAAAELYGVQALEATATTLTDGTELPFIKSEDYQYFGKLTSEVDESSLTKEQKKERMIMMLLLKIKCGTPPQRKSAMRQITDKARDFGASLLFQQILPLLSSPTLEDQERHLLVKVIDRVLYKLDELVRPYVSRILNVIEPLLIDEDYYARMEAREIISNLSKAAGLPTMIATMRPHIDAPDEYVRNVTARAFAVVAGALGVSQLLPFLKAVCRSKKSWQARHTGIKIVQQIASLMGCAVLPYLNDLVEVVSIGISPQQQHDQNKVRIMSALTLAALAEAAHPYGIESFDAVIRPLWLGVRQLRSKALAAYLKAIGFIIPLMEEGYAAHYTRQVMPILIREFQSPDEEMKKIVLKVIQQCIATDGVDAAYIRSEVLEDFFKNFWVRRMALDRRNHEQVVLTTVELANQVGSSDVLSRIVDDLKDDSEPYRRMVIETVQKVLSNLGAGDVDARLEERLIDGVLYAFQEQAVVDYGSAGTGTGVNGGGFGRDGQVMLDGFGTVVNSLGERSKPYLKQIAGTIKWRLNNKSAAVRMQAADLVGRIASVMKICKEDALMGHLGVVLYEYLGEEYPEVLGSILGALRAIVNVIGMTKMTPPIRDLLPRLTPIMRNRHEKVQENCIDLVGRIADRGAEYVSAKEWMRICFELLEMLKAHKKAIRRAAVSTFGYIAKAIGPQDVLHTLLNNLKVQDRQMRVCTTVAIAIVAESCGPFTVLPAVMNEYRVPELNIQNGVLKALSFMFEYIGDMARDYIFAIAPLLEDALMDRDPVHRQTGCTTVKHLALGVTGLGCEDALIHLLNFVWPNIFEESPHVIRAVFDAVEGLMVGLGPTVILRYTLQGLFHPARKVREVYWKVFNTLYIFSSDALVMGYPVLDAAENDAQGQNGQDTINVIKDKVQDEKEDFNSVSNNLYTRTTLELFI